jgi:predicted Zn-dependent protease
MRKLMLPLVLVLALQGCATSSVETFTMVKPDRTWQTVDALSAERVNAAATRRAVQAIVSLLDTIQRNCKSEELLRSTYRLEIGGGRTINAFYRNGTIRITQGMLVYARNSSEVAFVIAHELAHEFLGHDRRGDLPRHVKETTADNLAMEMISKAGFQREQAIRLLGRLADRYPNAHRGTDYPSYASRHRRLEAYSSTMTAALSPTLPRYCGMLPTARMAQSE